MRLGLLVMLMGVLPFVTGRFPTGQQQSETSMILLWLVPILFAVEMCAAAVWYGHEYDGRSAKPKLKRCLSCGSEFFEKRLFEPCPKCGGKAVRVR